ncbi:hypothetical protein DICVIV_05302 [Dictyocaulus viviparus]|uniref:Calcium uniporter protein n=1 Tax=Dictyocaulus viviparus TaxID=29172 RepID=A0A0D8XV92_DICVI|nr:hypothetical protein DICVIV_05302 [Dictyocaulus viviparus]
MKWFTFLCSSCFHIHRLPTVSELLPCRHFNGRPLTVCMLYRYSSTVPPQSCTDSSISVRFERGLPVLSVPLPSRQEPCRFSLRPLTDNVGVLCEQLQREDRGIDYVAVYAKDGVRIAMSTSIEHLLHFGEFRLRLNDTYYHVNVPIEDNYNLSNDKVRQIDDLRATIASLHASLCIDEYKVGREKRLIQQLEKAESELRPLHEKKLQIERDCDAHAERVMWAGFAAMGIQTGIFARLTWWEYSWDIMEPVTYFATYFTVVATFGYYLYTRQTFEYPSVRERVMTKQFYKRAIKEGFDIAKYNKLVEEVENVRNQLARIRDPLFQHLPVSYLTKLEDNTLMKDLAGPPTNLSSDRT